MRISIVTCLSALLFGGHAGANELAAPVRLKAGGEWIDTDVGHAAPYFADFDGDGKRDLLVGQFDDGKLKIYRNMGSNHNPDYVPATYFETQGKVVKVPTG